MNYRERLVVVENKLGLHARPAAELVKLASKFECEITISKDDMAVNGKSILGVMTLAAERGSMLLVKAEGSDAEQAVEQLAALLAHNYAEE